MIHHFQSCLRLASLLLALLAIGCGRAPAAGRDNPGKADRPAAVMVAEAVQKSLPVEITTFGTVKPLATVAVKSRIDGVLEAVCFRKGQDVRKGEVLFRLDLKPWENALQLAEAALARDTALHRNAVAASRRSSELLQKKFLSPADYDQSKAAEEALAASIQADQAAVENARLQIGYCTIRSPIDGRTGRYEVDPGNLVTANETTLVVINQIKPIAVNFSVPERELAVIHRAMASRSVAVNVVLPDEPDQPENGQLTFIDNAVDRGSGTIVLEATFPNDSGRLWPGQFVNLALEVAIQENVIVVPFRAIQTGQNGTYLFVVKDDQSVEHRPVTVGRRAGQDAIIADGLRPGESVVTDGQQRLAAGNTVEILAATPAKAVP